jgi:cytochrome bd-type quinol oxidase subunit 2
MAWKKSAATFSSFLAFGAVPVLLYMLFRGVYFGETEGGDDEGDTMTFVLSVMGSLITIFGLGVAHGHITKQNTFRR